MQIKSSLHSLLRVTKTIISRPDTSLDVANPLQDDGVFFNRSKTSSGRDYSLGIEQGDHRVLDEELSNNPEDAAWDQWREETLLHVFHTLFHQVWDAARPTLARSYEQFFYTHQQLLRRAALERELAGLTELEPLTPEVFSSGLGPGYRAGW